MTPLERAQAIALAEGPRLNQLVRAAVALAENRRRSPQAKADGILDIADALSKCIAPHTPCQKGCSHCCHMATAISGFEAAMIGRYTGRAPVPQGRQADAGLALQEELQARFTGAPCPFLVGGRCSIYPVRPVACRLHHSLNDDETDCRIQSREELDGRARATTPQLNLQAVTYAAAFIFSADDIGDIREFFPAKE